MSYFKKVEKRYDFKFFASHHYFTGYLIWMVGFWGIFKLWPDWVVWTLGLLGAWIVVDDWIQHWRQRKQVRNWGYYNTVSFWHWFPYELIGKKVE